MNVLVTGGTGTLGRQVVRLLRNSRHRARILSRNPRGHVDAIQGDLATGAGLIKALAGMDAIIHAASATTQLTKLRATDVVGTRRLPDFGGPEVRDFKGIAASWLNARKLNKRLIHLPLPFKFSRQFAEGHLLCPDHKDGKITFEQYLADKYPA